MKKPVATLGGLNDPAMMEEIIASGKAEKPNEGFARLVSFGEEHPELVELK